MPKYFFHICDGHMLIDSDGTLLSCEEDARAHAVTVAGELLRDAGKKRWAGTDWRLWVTREAGDVLFTLVFSVMAGTCGCPSSPRHECSSKAATRTSRSA
jgi:hypothetical protein